MSDIDFIKKVGKINVATACKSTGVNKSNVWSGRASKEKIKEVRIFLENQMKEVLSEK